MADKHLAHVAGFHTHRSPAANANQSQSTVERVSAPRDETRLEKRLREPETGRRFAPAIGDHPPQRPENASLACAKVAEDVGFF